MYAKEYLVATVPAQITGGGSRDSVGCTFSGNGTSKAWKPLRLKQGRYKDRINELFTDSRYMDSCQQLIMESQIKDFLANWENSAIMGRESLK